MIIRADVFKVTVFHAEAFRNCSELNKTEPFIKMACMNVAFYNGIKLKNSKTAFFCLNETVIYKQFSDMLSARFR